MNGTTMNDDAGFLSRWSRRKVQARQGAALEEPPVPVDDPVVAAVPAAEAATALSTQSVDATPAAAEPRPAPPTLADVQALTRESEQPTHRKRGACCPARRAK